MRSPLSSAQFAAYASVCASSAFSFFIAASTAVHIPAATSTSTRIGTDTVSQFRFTIAEEGVTGSMVKRIHSVRGPVDGVTLARS